MWKSDRGIIQIEIGSGVVKAFTEPDNRNILQALIADPPKEGGNFKKHIKQFRDSLEKECKLTFPAVYCVNDSALDYNEIRIYFGLEIYQFKVNSIRDIFNFIANKINEYNKFDIGVTHIKELLLSCLDDVDQDDYQSAYKKYSVIYYHCSFSIERVIPGLEFELIQSLSDGGGILLKNGDFQRALQFFEKAAFLCGNPNIVEPIIKLQVHLNAANACKVLQDFNKSYSYYIISANIAFYSGNYSHLFLALLNIAEVLYLSGHYKQSVDFLEQADSLLLEEEEPNFQISRNIQKSISIIKGELISKLSKEVKDLEKQLNDNRIETFFVNMVTEAFLALTKSAIKAFVCKKIGAKGNIGFALFGSFKFKDSTFVKSQIGDRNTMINIERSIGNEQN